MKNLLLCLTLTLCSLSVFAQYNQFRDDAAYRQRQYRYMARHKIKQADEYLSSITDTITSHPYQHCSVFYDTRGRIIKINYPHHVSAENPDSPSVTYTYNKNGKLTAIEKKAFYHQLKTFNYNAKGKLLQERYTTNIPADNAYGYHNYIIYNQYNKKGNVIRQIKLGPDSALVWEKWFAYSKRNSILKCITKNKDGVTRDVYSYQRYKGNLIKTVKSYTSNSLTLVRQYVYNKNHDQVKGYEIKNGVTKTVWDHVYNTHGMVTTSTGGPATDEALSDGDLRKDGLVPITYTYNTDGLLTQLTKTNYFPNMGKQITSVQKFVYKRY